MSLCSIVNFIPNATASYDFETGQQQNAIATEMGFDPDIESTFSRFRAGGATHRVDILNELGYIPVISTVTGAYRTLAGLAYSVKCLAGAIFDRNNRAKHKEGLKIGAANMGRGLLEIIPVVGNLATANIDTSRMMHRWAEHSGESYGDPRSIHQFQELDCLSAIPLVGSVIGAARVVFFSTHALVNIPPAVSGNPKYCEAIKFSAKQIGTGVISIIPGVGTVYLCFFGSCMRGCPDDGYISD